VVVQEQVKVYQPEELIVEGLEQALQVKVMLEELLLTHLQIIQQVAEVVQVQLE
jgi:hypothetical protein